MTRTINKPVVVTTASALGEGEIMLTVRDASGDVACVHLSMGDVAVLIERMSCAVAASLYGQRFEQAVLPELAQ